MLVIAGLSLKNLKPRVWDPQSPYHLPGLRAVMVSYADFHAMAARRKRAMEEGLHEYLGVPKSVEVHLDNGAFYFLRRQGVTPIAEYEEFVREARPDWYPIPQEFIPAPSMSRRKQKSCLERTMAVNVAFSQDGYVPVIHASRILKDYIAAIEEDENLSVKPIVAIGGLVPNLLRAPKAIPYEKVLASLWQARDAFADKRVHVFGIGGTATLHLAALIGFDSVDSSGWRNRAARGIIQLPGKGDRMIANLGNWRGRRADKSEMKRLERCRCPACRGSGITGLKARGTEGFCNRATHNLWVLLEEAEWISKRLKAGTYKRCYRRRLDNTIYTPLIKQALAQRIEREG